MMDTTNFNKLKKFVYDILTKEKVFQGEWHYGTVQSVISGKMLSVYVDGSTVAQKIPCNPKFRFNVGDEVFVHFINKDSKNKFIPFPRGVNIDPSNIKITTSSTAPSSPFAGDFWYKVVSTGNFEFNQRNSSNTGWDILNPVTKSTNVNMVNGQNLEDYLAAKFTVPSPTYTTLTLQNGVTIYATGSDPIYSKIGNVVYIKGVVKNISAANTVIGTLPASSSSVRPSIMTHNFTMPTSTITGTTARFARWSIGLDGTIKLEGTSDGVISATHWFPIHTSFVV